MKLASVQYLRAVAAVLVLLSHAATSLLRRERMLVDLSFGAYGVDIFFVLSGFIMVVSTAEQPPSPGSFLARRWVRIFPLYFLVTTLLLALAIWVLPDADTISSDLGAYLKSIFFIPHWNPKLHNLEPLLGQGWTLNYEAFFYVLFAAVLPASRNVRFLLLPAVLSLVCVAGAGYQGGSAVLLTYCNPLMLEFALGTLIAHLTLNSRPGVTGMTLVTGAALIGAGIAGCLLLAPAGPVLRLLIVGLPAALLVYVLVRVEQQGRLPRWRFLEIVGDASYSLYLTHTLVLGAGRRIWQRLFDIEALWSHVAFIAVSVLACVAVSIGAYLAVERPLTRMLTRRVKKT